MAYADMRRKLPRKTAVWIQRHACPGVLVALQIMALAILNHAGYVITSLLQTSLPGNLVGMLLLLTLLASGVIRLSWLESGASLLLKHLAFFFIPIAVGIMNFAELLRESGIALLAVLLVSALFGIWVSGMASQWLAHEERLRTDRDLTWKRDCQS